jgi:TRAP-type C4-dicarboxylate transport system permease small subunit
MIVEGIALCGLAVMVLATLIGVLDRFIVGAGLPWPEELARFLLIWTSLLSAAVATRRGQHYRLSFLYEKLGRSGATAIDIVCISTLGVVFWQGIRLVRIFNNQISPALSLPMSYVYAAVPVSAALISWYLLQGMITRWRMQRTATGTVDT